MNVQELATVVGNHLPVKIFVLSNNGYLSIRQTQTGFFQGRKIGESKDSGVTFPCMLKVGQAYGLPSFTVATVQDLEIVRRELDTPGQLCLTCNSILPRSLSRGFAPGSCPMARL